MQKRFIFGLATTMLLASMATTASAGSTTFRLTRESTLTNVDDAEGRWQFDGGNVYIGRNLVGHYTRSKRISFGVPTNKHAMEMTIMLNDTNSNFTVQGSHYFTTGEEIGGVSAASAGLSAIQHATFTGDSDTLTINF